MAELIQQPLVMEGAGWADYGLVDSGHGRKLERYGPHRFIRPEPQAMWSPRLADWQADGEFVPGSDEDGGGRWHFAQPVPEDGWPLAWNEVRFARGVEADRGVRVDHFAIAGLERPAHSLAHLVGIGAGAGEQRGGTFALGVGQAHRLRCFEAAHLLG